MKNMFTQKIGSLLGILVVAFIGVTLATTSAHALLAAGTTISNTAHVDWAEDGTGTGLDSPPVNVTVNLVSGLVWDDTSLSPGATQSVASGAAVSYTVDLLNTGNGSTTVTLTDNTPSPGANLNADESFSTSPTTAADLTLAGTVASGAGVFGGVTTAIPVSNVDVANLEVGVTRIHINGVTGTYFVVAAGSTATSLVVTGDASAVVAGDQLGEVVNITYSGTVATLSSSPTTGIHDHALLASDEVGATGFNADGNAFSTDTLESDANGATGTDWRTSVVAGNLTIAKYVRNDSNAAHNPAAAADLVYNGTDYWTSGVTGDTGNILEYIVILSNTGAGAATDVTMTDSISAFTSLNTTNVSVDEDNDGTFEHTDAITDSVAGFASPVLTVYAGVGGASPTGGSLAAATSSAVVYQSTIQ